MTHRQIGHEFIAACDECAAERIKSLESQLKEAEKVIEEHGYAFQETINKALIQLQAADELANVVRIYHNDHFSKNGPVGAALAAYEKAHGERKT